MMCHQHGLEHPNLASREDKRKIMLGSNERNRPTWERFKVDLVGEMPAALSLPFTRGSQQLRYGERTARGSAIEKYKA